MSERNEFARINQESGSEQQSVLSLVSLTQGSRSVTTGEKIAATASVLSGGIADGTINKAREALSDPTSLLKIGGSAAVGAALTFANGRQGILRLGARAAMVGLGGLFAVDLYHKGSETAGLLKDTWHSPANAGGNREKVAQTLGPLVVDTMLYGAGGGLGVAAAKTFMPVKPRLLAARVGDIEAGAGFRSTKVVTDRAPHAQEPLETGQIEFHVLEQGSVFNPNRTMKVPLESPIGKTVSVAKESVAKVEVLTLNGRGELGGGTSTAVAVTADGKLAVNKHLIDGAVSVSVFDSQARPHSAHVFRVNPDKEVDLAILQLDSPSSYSHFKPLEFAHPDGLKAGTQVAFLGHPEGYNHMFVSPGTVAAKGGRGVTATFHANVRAGNCGSAICDMDGKLLAIMKSEGELVNGSPASLVRSLLESKTFDTGNVAPKSGQAMPYVQKFEIKEPDKALLAIEEIFGVKLKEGEVPADFYHARARKATYKSSSSQAEILLKTEYLPEHGEAVIRPAAKDGKPLKNNMHWPGTTIPINTAELRLRFTDGFQSANMASVNDPYNVLTAGFELRGRFFTYLSELKPHRLH